MESTLPIETGVSTRVLFLCVVKAGAGRGSGSEDGKELEWHQRHMESCKLSLRGKMPTFTFPLWQHCMVPELPRALTSFVNHKPVRGGVRMAFLLPQFNGRSENVQFKLGRQSL